MVHELAHEVLHRDGVKRPKVVKETEAEAVAFVVCEAAGLETNTASRDYIHLYAGDKKALLASLERIRRIAIEVIGAVMPEKTQRVLPACPRVADMASTPRGKAVA